jgi:hypothetical protein
MGRSFWPWFGVKVVKDERPGMLFGLEFQVFSVSQAKYFRSSHWKDAEKEALQTQPQKQDR